MTEAEARAWFESRVPRETLAKLERLAELVTRENDAQNLIAASTVDHIWARHLLDSAQLRDLAEDANGGWCDLGSGAGFPGLVIALLTDRPVTLIESRRRRVDHLRHCVAELGLDGRVEVLGQRVESVSDRTFRVISARAFAPSDRLFASAHHLSTNDTLWVLPKGRGAAEELEAAGQTWQGAFRIVPSLTDAESSIIVAQRVRRRRQA